MFSNVSTTILLETGTSLLRNLDTLTTTLFRHWRRENIRVNGLAFWELPWSWRHWKHCRSVTDASLGFLGYEEAGSDGEALAAMVRFFKRSVFE